MTELVRTERRDGVATIVLNRPQVLNALDEPLRAALLAALVDADGDPEVGAVVLTGAGRGFCVGQDLGASDELDDCYDTVHRTYNPIALHVAAMGTPVVAAVNGPAVGAGMGLALGCDLVMMSDRASMSCAFGKVGLVPDTGTTWYLTRLLGHARAFDLATSGRRIGAEEAQALGLVTEVHPAEDLLAVATARAVELAAGPRLAFALTKRAVREAPMLSLQQTLEVEAQSQGLAGASAEHRALRDAFLNR